MRNKVLVISIALVLVAAALSAACAPAPAPAPAAPIELKLAESMSPKHKMTTHGYEAWAKMVEEATNGRVKVTVFPGGALAKTPEAYDATIAGVADVAMIVQSVVGEARFPLTMVMNLPMIFPNATVASRVAQELYEKFPEIRAEYSEVKVLFFYSTSAYQLHTAEKPVHTLEVLKGLQIRAAGRMAGEIVKALGATPVNIPMDEAYMALSKGVIDGLVAAFGPLGAFKLTEVTKYHVDNADLYTSVFCVVMNLDKWNSLPPDIQKAIDEISGATGAELFGTVFDSTGEPDIKALTEMGDIFITLTPEEKARWVEAVMPLREQWLADMAAKGLPGDKVLNEALRLAEKYSK